MQCRGDKINKGEKPGKVKVIEGYVTTKDGVRLFYQEMGEGPGTVIIPNARLVTIENAVHLPWIESPEIVSEAIKTFFDGKWPQTAEVVKKIVPEG